MPAFFFMSRPKSAGRKVLPGGGMPSGHTTAKHDETHRRALSARGESTGKPPMNGEANTGSRERACSSGGLNSARTAPQVVRATYQPAGSTGNGAAANQRQDPPAANKPANPPYRRPKSATAQRPPPPSTNPPSMPRPRLAHHSNHPSNTHTPTHTHAHNHAQHTHTPSGGVSSPANAPGGVTVRRVGYAVGEKERGGVCVGVGVGPSNGHAGSAHTTSYATTSAGSSYHATTSGGSHPINGAPKYVMVGQAPAMAWAATATASSSSGSQSARQVEPAKAPLYTSPPVASQRHDRAATSCTPSSPQTKAFQRKRPQPPPPPPPPPPPSQGASQENATGQSSSSAIRAFAVNNPTNAPTTGPHTQHAHADSPTQPHAHTTRNLDLKVSTGKANPLVAYKQLGGATAVPTHTNTSPHVYLSPAHYTRHTHTAADTHTHTHTHTTSGEDVTATHTPFSLSTATEELESRNVLRQLRSRLGMEEADAAATGDPRRPRGRDLYSRDVPVPLVADGEEQCSPRHRLYLQQVMTCRLLSYKSTTDFYTFGKVLGQGSFAKVRVALHKLTGQQVAIKTYEKAKLKDSKHWRRVQQEIRLMERLNHPRVIRLFETMESPKRIHIVMEYLGGGNLCSYVKAKKRLDEAEAREIFGQIAESLEYIHNLNIVHRDIKLENVLFDESRRAKLVDFGFSVMCRDKRLHVFCGTPSYMAPEIVKRKEYLGRPVDLWSMGVVLYALLCGRFPFSAKTYPDLYKKIARGMCTIPDELSPAARDLISSLLVVDPDSRYTLPQTRAHPWLSGTRIGVYLGAGGRTDSHHHPHTNPQHSHTSTGGSGNGANGGMGGKGAGHQLVPKFLLSTNAQDDLERPAVERMERFGVARDLVVQCVLQRKRNAIATTYYLLREAMAQEKRQRDIWIEGGLSATGSQHTSSTSTQQPTHSHTSAPSSLTHTHDRPTTPCFRPQPHQPHQPPYTPHTQSHRQPPPPHHPHPHAHQHQHRHGTADSSTPQPTCTSPDMLLRGGGYQSGQRGENVHVHAMTHDAGVDTLMRDVESVSCDDEGTDGAVVVELEARGEEDGGSGGVCGATLGGVKMAVGA